jgi:hypothetical protein
MFGPTDSSPPLGANGTCDAYPKGIPAELIRKEADHRLAYPGDNGIRFEREQLRK